MLKIVLEKKSSNELNAFVFDVTDNSYTKETWKKQ